MSKILKRTLTFALIFCMLLSVLPAASAEETEAAVTYTYSFTGSGNISDVAAPTENPDNDAWWAYYGNSLGTGTLSSRNATFNPTNASHWLALTIYIPTEGQYDITWEYYGGACRNVIGLIEKSANDVTAVAGKGAASNSHPLYEKATVKAVVNNRISSRVGQDSGVAYLGNVSLNAGEYVLLIQAVYGDASSSNNYQYFNSLTLTKNDVAGKDFLAKLKTDKVYDSTQDRGTGGQLCADLVTSSDLALGTLTRLDLQGYNLTVNSLSTVAHAHIFDSTDGEGTLTVTSGAPALQADNGAWDRLTKGTYYVQDDIQLTLNAGTNAYKFTTPTVALADALQTPVDANNDNAIVFNVTLPNADNYTYVDEDIEVTLTLQVGENEAKTYYFSDNGDAENANQVAAWATNAGAGDKLFYADLNNLEAIAGETLTVTAQISWNNVVISSTVDYAIPAAE